MAARELPRFPSVTRDLSFFVDEGVTAARIREADRGARDAAVRRRPRARGLSRRQGPAGKKGMLWTFIYRAPDRTLTDAEVQKLHDDLVDKLVEAAIDLR